MAALYPKLVQAMRDELDEGMTRVPTECATSETKAYLAEHILKAAAQGRTTITNWPPRLRIKSKISCRRSLSLSHRQPKVSANLPTRAEVRGRSAEQLRHLSPAWLGNGRLVQ
jgi:hypothetical protein